MGAAVIYTTKMPQKLEAGAKLTAHRQEFDLNGTDDTYDGYVLNGYVGDRVGRFSYMLGASSLEMTGQPSAFALINRTGAALQGDETPIASGAFPIVDRRGAERYHIGVAGQGIETTQQDEFKLKLGYDFTPTLEGRFTVAGWTMDSLTGKKPQYTTYLRDDQGNPVYSGPVEINGERFVIGDNVFAPRSGNDEHFLYAATLRTKNQSGWNYEAAASLYDISEQVLRTSSSPRDVAFSTGSAGTLSALDGSGWWHIDLKADRKLGADGEHWLTIGAHHSNYELQQGNYQTADWRNGGPGAQTGANQGTTEVSALFAQDAWQFAEQWKTVLGLRLESWKARDGSRSTFAGGVVDETVAYDNRSETAVSPKAALIYTPNHETSYRLSVAQSTRFPTVAELFQGSVSAGEIVGSDPNLKPEEALSVDFTIETLLNNAVMRVSLWGEDIDNTIFRYQEFNVSDNTAGSTLYQNVDRVRVKGIEWVYDTWSVFGVQGLDLHANLAFNESEVLADSGDPRNVGNEFYRIPRIRGALVATYQHTEKLDYTLAGRYSGRSRGSLDNTDINRHAIDATSNFTVFDFRINYDINRYVGIGGGVNNLLDERYYVGHPYQGRTVFADVKVTY